MISTTANPTRTTTTTPKPSSTTTTLSHHLKPMTTIKVETTSSRNSMAANSPTVNKNPSSNNVPHHLDYSNLKPLPPTPLEPLTKLLPNSLTIAKIINVNPINADSSLSSNSEILINQHQHYHYNQLEQCQAPIVQRPPMIGGITSDSNGNCSTVGAPLTADPLGTINGNSIGGDEKFLEVFNPEQLNFSDHQQVWIKKEWLDILFRVSFVAPIVLLGIIGNLTIIYSMCKFKKFRLKPTNIFILNMAIADLLTTMVCPISALFTDIYQFYVLGSFICRFEGFVKITCLLVSSYSLIILSSDWLLCVVKPCRTRISIKQSWLVLCTIWITSILMALPLFVWRRLRERQWHDLVEVWCCELIQYTKYYWVVITFFLIYLPTFFMTIVLIVILAQMDKFEAKMKRSTNPSNSNSLTINMKYRRRIAKILFSYLLTSIVCWTPLQFTIIYRHFRSEPIPSPWFFELAFFSQLSASLTAAMNPIIFGFLSQPFRRIVAKWLMFKFINKAFVTTNTRNNSGQPQNHQNHNHNHHHRANQYHRKGVQNDHHAGGELNGSNQTRHFPHQQSNNINNNNNIGSKVYSQRSSLHKHALNDVDFVKQPTVLPHTMSNTKSCDINRRTQAATTSTATYSVERKQKVGNHSSNHRSSKTKPNMPSKQRLRPVSLVANSSLCDHVNKRVSFDTSTQMDQRYSLGHQLDASNLEGGRDNVAYDPYPENNNNTHIKANDQWLSSNTATTTTTTTTTTTNYHDSAQRSGPTFSGKEVVSKQEQTPKKKQPVPSESSNQFNTTSFIQRKRAVNSPLSLVSMDSINIEENFCSSNLTSFEQNLKENEEN